MCEITDKKKMFSEHFSRCRPVLSAIGDSNRQLIIKILIDHCGEGGIRE